MCINAVCTEWQMHRIIIVDGKFSLGSIITKENTQTKTKQTIDLDFSRSMFFPNFSRRHWIVYVWQFVYITVWTNKYEIIESIWNTCNIALFIAINSMCSKQMRDNLSKWKKTKLKQNKTKQKRETELKENLRRHCKGWEEKNCCDLFSWFFERLD